MTEREFAISEHRRDRELTARQLAAVRGRPGQRAYEEKYTAQLARIDAKLARLRGVTPLDGAR